MSSYRRYNVPLDAVDVFIALQVLQPGDEILTPDEKEKGRAECFIPNKWMVFQQYISTDPTYPIIAGGTRIHWTHIKAWRQKGDRNG